VCKDTILIDTEKFFLIIDYQLDVKIPLKLFRENEALSAIFLTKIALINFLPFASAKVKAKRQNRDTKS
jgi:hypothetical protein